ncbi:MAG: DUF11 domain-containing protein [Rhodothermia bacterium]|nr:DUF11 domain-containing protein [Rhodothermia bacterium]
MRVEFTIPETGCQLEDGTDFSGLNGGVYGSSVQFLANAAAASRTANFALHYPGEYGGAAAFVPDIYSTAQFSGNPLVAGTTATQNTVYKSAYTAAGTVGSTTLANRQVGLTPLAKNAQTGSVWGMVYSKQAQRLFVSAMIKRHAGMGPLGPGGIYMINPSTPDLVGSINFVSLDALGFPTHATGTYGAGSPLTIGSNTDRGLPANAVGVPTRDQYAYDQVGKTSLGDIELSEDGRYLFVVNLYDRKLYRIDLQNAASPVTPTAAQVTSYSIPNPCTATNAGEPRPWALKTHRGKVLTGVVCSGQTAANVEVGTSATMSANVMEFDPTTLIYAATPLYTQNLSYRNPIVLQYNIAGLSAAWQPWLDTWSTNSFLFGAWAPGQSAVVSTQPVVADIEFDADGNMILGLLDRHGHQTGSANYDLAGTGSYSKAFANGDNLHLTKSATCTYSSTAIDYYDDCVKWRNNDTDPPYGNNCDHNEVFFGSLASHRFGDKDELVTSSLNPVLDVSNGYMIVNNDDGSHVRGNEIWRDPNWPNSAQTVFGKAAGIGDMEMLGVQSPIEIGNRVWLDTDNDGVQDAGEAGISGVTVELVKAGTTLATATTDANGNYYFSSATGTDTASIKYGLTQLEPNMAYTVRFPTTTTVAGTTYNLTTAAAGSNRLIDSNAPASGDVTVLATDIPVSGANNHSFDVGYRPTPVTVQTCPGPYGGNGAIGDPAQWVVIGDPGNPADGPSYSTVVNGNTIVHNNPNQVGYGSVNYTYSIADGFVTVKDYLRFLNAVDPTNTLNFEGDLLNQGLVQYSGGVWSAGAFYCISLSPAEVEKVAVTRISLNQKARYANWVATGNVNTGAYTFASADGNANITAIDNTFTGVRLLTENEYYKAAFWDQSNNTYNLYGTTGLQANGTPIVSGIGAGGMQTNNSGVVYNLSSPDPNICWPQVQSGQGGRSTYGVSNMAGGFHNSMIPNSPSFPITNDVLRPDNLASTEVGQRSSYRNNSITASGFYPSPSFQIARTGNACDCEVVVVTADPTSCNTTDNTYGLNGIITFPTAPTSGTLTISVPGGTPLVLNPPFLSPIAYSLTALPADGTTKTVTATFSSSALCVGTKDYFAPTSCSSGGAGQPDLKLLKTASSSSVNSGQTLTYTITLTNEGTASATGVVIRDVLPAAVAYVSSSASQGSYNNATGLWTVGTVAVGASLTLTLTVTVN